MKYCPTDGLWHYGITDIPSLIHPTKLTPHSFAEKLQATHTHFLVNSIVQNVNVLLNQYIYLL